MHTYERFLVFNLFSAAIGLVAWQEINCVLGPKKKDAEC